VRIFHIATAADWEAARRTGTYTTSTYGVPLADEGFIHASRGDQWQGVRDRYYGLVTEPLLLLAIDPNRLSAPVVEESPPGTEETFPHIYGPIDPDAVVRVIPLGTGRDPRTAGAESFGRLFVAEVFHNLLLAVLVMACVALGAVLGAVIGAVIGGGVDDRWGALVGIAVGLAVGLPLAVIVHRRRVRRHATVAR
jgi:uncharacterized protein (DUF952 family)